MTIPAADVGLLGLDEWAQLEPVETGRMELVDGVVIMSPRPNVAHMQVVGELFALVREASAGRPLLETEVLISGAREATVRVPDLVVLHAGQPVPDRPRLAPDEIELAVEIVSPGSRRTDYIAKRYDYEQAGIAFYWIIDPDERRVTCLELRDGHYVEYVIDRDADSMIISRPLTIRFSRQQLLHR